MKDRLCRSLFAGCIAVGLLASPAPAQTGNQGSIAGVVTDSSGAVVPSATLRITEGGKSIRFSIQSNENGYFSFPVVPVGTYTLEAERAGFAAFVVKDIEVTVGAHVNIPIPLRPAGQSASVVVTAEPPLFEPTRSQLSSVIDSRATTNLPVNGRDFVSFALLAPGVTTDVRGGLSFAGQRAMNSVLVDGASYDNTFWNQAWGNEGFAPPGQQGVYAISLEVVQEYQVNTNAYSAEFGRAAGGVINAVTKSGGNRFHGSAFWFYRDRSMNASNPLNNAHGLPKDPYHFHQSGGTFSGPVRKDRLFFLVSYDVLRSKIRNPVVLGLPPGFRMSSDPTVAGFQQQALNYISPRAESWDFPSTQNAFMAKFDWNASSSHLLSLRWNRQTFSGNGLGGNPQTSLENTSSTPSNTDFLTFSLSSALSPSLANVARVSYAHSWSAFQPESFNPEARIYEGGQLVLVIGRCQCTPQEWPVDRGQWSDTVSYSHGSHIWRVGIDALQDRLTYFNATRFSGSYVFRSLESFGRSLAGHPTPLPNDQYVQAFSGFGTAGITTQPNVFQLAGFAADEWRVRRNLTLNLGLRYDIEVISRPPVKNPSQALAAAGYDTSLLHTDKNNFAPRFGFAWTPHNSGHVVVRGGYGLFYAMTPALVASRADYLNGVSVQQRVFSGGGLGAELIPAYPNTVCGPPAPSGIPPSCAAPVIGASAPSIVLFSPDHREGYSQQWSMGIEMLLAKNVAFSVSYVGVKGTHLLRTRDVNLAIPTTPEMIAIAGTSTVLTYHEFANPRPVAGFDRILLFESTGNSIYHGLAMQLNRRFSHKFQLLGSYTFGKVIDDNPNQYAVNPGTGDSLFLSDPSNTRTDRSAGVNDQRHHLVLSGVWQLAYASHLPGLAGTILKGWQASGILTAQSGQPYSGMVDFDLNKDGNGATDRTPGLGRNTYRLPGTVTLDGRLSRDVRLKEGVNLIFLGEAFNLFNHANLADVQRTQNTFSVAPAACGIAGTPCLNPVKGFGFPIAYLPSRIMQLAIRMTF